MSFFGALAPLYLAGLLAIGIPIVLHFIRRSPKGRVPFSTLMFLESSPPRMTRRSSLDNLLLLIIRALAIILIVIAFCRPFFRFDSQESVAANNGRLIAIVIDRSASMQRGDLWQQALNQVNDVLDEMSPADRACLIAFDDRPETVVEFPDDGPSSDDPAVNVAVHRELIRESQKSLSPGSRATDHGAALVTACGLLQEQHSLRDAHEKNRMQVVLISDMQRGSNFAALQAFEWPENILLSTRTLDPPTGNASVNVLQQSPDDTEDQRLRVRVSNIADSTQDEFTVRWYFGDDASGQSEMKTDEKNVENGERIVDQNVEVRVQVPPGQSRVVRLAAANPERVSMGVELVGDSEVFDNVFYLPTNETSLDRIEFVEKVGAKGQSGLHFFFSSLFDESEIEVVSVTPGELLASGVMPDSVVVASDSAEANDRILEFVRQGGRALVVVTDENMQPTVSSLLDDESISLSEAKDDRFTLLADIDFKHPVFSLFADPNFSDFTTGRFWKYRKLSGDTLDRNAADSTADIADGKNEDSQVVARFDTGDPALIHRIIGRGELYVLASGWNPQDSQLAVWNKFPPLTMMMLGRSGSQNSKNWYTVGEKVNVGVAVNDETKSEFKLTGPDGNTTVLTAAEDGQFSFTPELPGRYMIDDSESVAQINRQSFVVNLDLRESITDPIDSEQLTEYRVQMGEQATAEQVSSQERQMQNRKLEQSQRVWSLLILAAIALLFAETILAGWLARRGNVELSGNQVTGET